MNKDSNGYEDCIRRCFDHLYANGNVRTSERIAEEVAKVLLALVWAKSSKRTELESLTIEERGAIKAGNPVTVRRISELVYEAFREMNETFGRYAKGSTIELDPASLAFVYSEVCDVDFESAERDWIGDAAEVFRSMAAKRLGGQFFTDQRVTELAVTLLEFNPQSGDDFLDVCAGTGGFLVAAAKRQAGTVRSYSSQVPLFDDGWIKGLEVDPDLVHLANGSMLAMGQTAGNCVLRANSLTDEEWNADVRRHVIPGTHRCLASNPPFGTKITVKDASILNRYELACSYQKKNGKWIANPRKRTPRPPDILFIERNLQLAEPGNGRVALVTPYQVLSGPQLGFVREWILRNSRVRAIVDLPPETFQPWTGTKTSLIILERRTKALDEWDASENYPIFMAVSKFIGHDRRGKPIYREEGGIKTDLPQIEEAYRAWRDGGDPSTVHPDAFVISSNQIAQADDVRLNAAFYRPAQTRLRTNLVALPDDNWVLKTVGDVTKRIFFPTRFKRDYVDEGSEGVLFLSGTNISQLIPTNRKYIARGNPRFDELRVEAGWLLVTRSGSTGVVSSVPKAWDGLTMSEHVIRIIPDETKLDPGYLEAYLRSSIGQQLLNAGIFGSVIDEITPEHIGALPIPIPKDREMQRRVGNVIRNSSSARDEAIRSIQNAVGTLEQNVKEAVDSTGAAMSL